MKKMKIALVLGITLSSLVLSNTSVNANSINRSENIKVEKTTKDNGIFSWMPNIETQIAVLNKLISDGILPSDSITSDITKEILSQDHGNVEPLQIRNSVTLAPNMFKGLEYYNNEIGISYEGADNDGTYALANLVDFEPLRQHSNNFNKRTEIVFNLFDYNEIPNLNNFKKGQSIDNLQTELIYTNAIVNSKIGLFLPRLSRHLEKAEYENFYVDQSSFWSGNENVSDSKSYLTAIVNIKENKIVLENAYNITSDGDGTSHYVYTGGEDVMNEIKANPSDYYIVLQSLVEDNQPPIRLTQAESNIFFGFK